MWLCDTTIFASVNGHTFCRPIRIQGVEQAPLWPDICWGSGAPLQKNPASTLGPVLLVRTTGLMAATTNAIKHRLKEWKLLVRY